MWKHGRSHRPTLHDKSPEKQHILQMDIIAIPNNTIVVAYNDSPNKRSPLRLATSKDGGVTWVKAAVIENDPEGSFHYPALLYDPKKVKGEPVLRLSIEPTVLHSLVAGMAQPLLSRFCHLHQDLHRSPVLALCFLAH